MKQLQVDLHGNRVNLLPVPITFDSRNEPNIIIKLDEQSTPLAILPTLLSLQQLQFANL